MALSIQTGVVSPIHPNRHGGGGLLVTLDSDATTVHIHATGVQWPQAINGAHVYLLIDSAAPARGFMLGIASTT